MFFTFYRQDLPEGQLCRYCFYRGTIFGFFAPQGRHVALMKVKFGIGSLPKTKKPKIGP